MKIKAGSLHQANGGILILQAKDLLLNPHSWQGLVRALKTAKIQVENMMGNNVVTSIKPQAIPIELKIVLVGDPYTYQMLYAYEDNFKKFFKIHADFDVEMKRSTENVRKIATFVERHCERENLMPFSKDALGKIVEYSSRIAGHQDKLTAQFNEMVEILYEANTLSIMDEKEEVNKKYIERAINERNNRNNKYEEHLMEYFKDDVLLIDTTGESVGQINGLAVLDSGQYSFGKPSRITVSSYLGKEGIVNIEREVEQSGSSHDKGVLIITGFLGTRYAKKYPLSLNANITFEQSYGMIDGDSASSTELYGLLSSLSDVPIKQSFAVTGSVNQKGQIQPIGGINEKIEGFYKVCKLKGLTGEQGIVMPYQNVKDLMLNDEVIDAVSNNKFHIYAVSTIDEGIEILTGVEAGSINEKNEYPTNSINGLVQAKLNKFAELLDQFEEEE
jgi:lon-related putative ATP-dependent protease